MEPIRLKRRRVMMPRKAVAEKLLGGSAIITLPLPPGFYALPPDGQREVIHRELGEIAREIEDVLDDQRVSA